MSASAAAIPGTSAAPAASVAVSAVVPNYNHGRLLPAAVAALAGQTAPPAEIIVVDDGSTDDSREVIADLMRRFPTVRLVAHETNRGAIAALNTGIAAATRPYLYLGAADDAAMPRLIEVLSGAIARRPGCALYCGEVRLVNTETGASEMRPVTRPSPAERAFSPAETRRMLARTDNFIMTSAALLDREKVIAAGALRGELGSFADGFLVRQLALRHGFCFLPEELAQWRVSSAGLSRSTAADPAAVERLILMARAAFASDPVFPPDYADRFVRRWRFGVLRLALAQPGDPRPVIEAAAPGPPGARRLLGALARVPWAGRTAALAWLTLAFRPFPLHELAATAVGRRIRPARPSERVPRA